MYRPPLLPETTPPSLRLPGHHLRHDAFTAINKTLLSLRMEEGRGALSWSGLWKEHLSAVKAFNKSREIGSNFIRHEASDMRRV